VLFVIEAEILVSRQPKFLETCYFIDLIGRQSPLVFLLFFSFLFRFAAENFSGRTKKNQKHRVRPADKGVFY